MYADGSGGIDGGCERNVQDGRGVSGGIAAFSATMAGKKSAAHCRPRDSPIVSRRAKPVRVCRQYDPWSCRASRCRLAYKSVREKPPWNNIDAVVTPWVVLFEVDGV